MFGYYWFGSLVPVKYHGIYLARDFWELLSRVKVSSIEEKIKNLERAELRIKGWRKVWNREIVTHLICYQEVLSGEICSDYYRIL